MRVRPPSADGRAAAADGPCARLGHSFTLASDGIAYVFGGLANDSGDPKFNVPKYLNDLYAIELTNAPNNLCWTVPKVEFLANLRLSF